MQEDAPISTEVLGQKGEREAMMPVKMMAFLKAKKDMSRAAFIAHYETHHVPLIRSIMPGIVDYRRNFLPDSVTGFDVVTEIWFADHRAFDAAMSLARKSPGADLIAEDEERLFDRSQTRVCVVEERGGLIAA